MVYMGIPFLQLLCQVSVGQHLEELLLTASVQLSAARHIHEKNS